MNNRPGLGRSLRPIGPNEFARVSEYVTALRHRESEVDALLSRIGAMGNLILIGGCIRDVSLGLRPRDFDIVIDTRSIDLREALGGFQYSQNRFGGYKIQVSRLVFDVWTVGSNWASRAGIIEHEVDELPHGVFFNVDGLIHSVTGLYSDASYFNGAVHSGLLDIVIPDAYVASNPSPEVNVLRALIMKDRWGLSFSPRVESYIARWLSQSRDPVGALWDAAGKHYGRRPPLTRLRIRELCQGQSRICRELY
ncbi:MAG: hypothetical protein ACM3WU_05040 [Bacillota bacterium]